MTIPYNCAKTYPYHLPHPGLARLSLLIFQLIQRTRRNDYGNLVLEASSPLISLLEWFPLLKIMSGKKIVDLRRRGRSKSPNVGALPNP